MTFRDAKPDHMRRPYLAKTGEKRVGHIGVLRFPGYVIWTCDHIHADWRDALGCAEQVLHCDDGSLCAEELTRAAA